MRAAYTIASKAARVCRCRCERMFTPGLADLFEPLIVSRRRHSFGKDSAE